VFGHGLHHVTSASVYIVIKSFEAFGDLGAGGSISVSCTIAVRHVSTCLTLWKFL
jgi:hypothetical protein